MGPRRFGRGVKNRCIHCHKSNEDQWRRLIGQSVHAASIRTPVSAEAFTRVGRMLRGPTAGSARRNTDRQRSCCSDDSGILAEGRTSLPTVDAGKAIFSPGSGVEPQGVSLCQHAVKGQRETPESNWRLTDYKSVALPTELVSSGG